MVVSTHCPPEPLSLENLFLEIQHVGFLLVVVRTYYPPDPTSTRNPVFRKATSGLALVVVKVHIATCRLPAPTRNYNLLDYRSLGKEIASQISSHHEASLTSWRFTDIMTSWRLPDIMKAPRHHHGLLTSWHHEGSLTLWHHEGFLTSWMLPTLIK